MELQQIATFTYQLKIHGEYSADLYDVLRKKVKLPQWDKKANTLCFSAEKVMTFPRYLVKQKQKQRQNHLSYKQCVKIIDDLSTQLFALRQKGLAFYGFDAHQILCIDDNTFLFCGTQHLAPLSEEDDDSCSILIMKPILSKPYFTNPEIHQLTTLPAQIPFQSCYYSLGVLIVLALLDTYLFAANEQKTPEQIEELLEPLVNTKIYWFLKRCLDEEPSRRRLLFI